MGRWAQRSRGGGGITPLNAILKAFIFDADVEDLTYQHNVDASTLVPAAFVSNPSTRNPTTIAQVTPRKVRLQYPDAIDADTTVTYSGATGGIRTPQTIAIT